MRNPEPEIALDSPLLSRTTTIVRNRSTVFDQLHAQACRLQGSDRTFTSGTRSLDADLDFFHAKFLRFFSSLLRGTLAGKWRTFSTSLEAGSPGTRPTQRIAFGVRDGNRRVVKRRFDVGNTHGHVTPNSSLLLIAKRERTSLSRMKPVARASALLS